MMELDTIDRQGLQVAANYAHFRDDLLEFDYKRFRGLGEAHTAKFVAHGVRVCNSFQLDSYDAVLKVLQTMCFLGSHMLEDPRFTSLVEILRQPTVHGDARLPEFTAQTQDILLTLAGENLEIYRSTLRAYLETQDRHMDPRQARTHILNALPGAARPRAENWYPTLVQSAREAITDLNLHAETGLIFCLVAAAALGTGFYRDPLYPWIRDKATADPHKSAAFRTERLVQYANRRIRGQLRIMEHYYGV